eukprot:9512031-Alexandrium_andersonii.AAC.1
MATELHRQHAANNDLAAAIASVEALRRELEARQERQLQGIDTDHVGTAPVGLPRDGGPTSI